MKFVYFTHSLASCWNHGNAHFLRGVLRDLVHRGHAVETFEPRGAWSLENLLADHGEAGLAPYQALYPELNSTPYGSDIDLSAALEGADVVIVHEWNEPWLVAAIGAMRRAGGCFTLLFHDTHHRAVSDPDAIRTFDLDGYDGVLAFGETLAQVYRRWGWGDRVWVWHEAADVRLFRPPPSPGGGGSTAVRPAGWGESPLPRAGEGFAPPRRGVKRAEGEGEGNGSSPNARSPHPSPLPQAGEGTPAVGAVHPTPSLRSDPPPPGEGGDRRGLVWIGNWGDEERSAELEDYLFRPAQHLGLPLEIYGVRYPQHALETLAHYGVAYRGWLPNARAPEVFARHLATVHVPRRFYVDVLPGIPTIRVFEALACGIPLVSAPWSDSEGLFRIGRDFLMARSGVEMERHLAAVRDDPDLRAALVASGLETIHARHTCAHRVDELLAVVARLAAPASLELSA